MNISSLPSFTSISKSYLMAFCSGVSFFFLILSFFFLMGAFFFFT